MKMNVNSGSALKFANSIFSGRLPPGDPFVREEWIGAAFDRNRYEQLAPLEWWRAVISCAAKNIGEAHVYFVERRHDHGLSSASAVTIGNSEKAIFDYLDGDARFLRDQYLIGESGMWACLLDQDVSLFGGDKKFMAACYAEYGGRSRLLSQMRDDMLGDPLPVSNSSDQFVIDFESYFQRLLGL